VENDLYTNPHADEALIAWIITTGLLFLFLAWARTGIA
jgi:hypothetical protein